MSTSEDRLLKSPEVISLVFHHQSKGEVPLGHKCFYRDLFSGLSSTSSDLVNILFRRPHLWLWKGEGVPVGLGTGCMSPWNGSGPVRGVLKVNANRGPQVTEGETETGRRTTYHGESCGDLDVEV